MLSVLAGIAGIVPTQSRPVLKARYVRLGSIQSNYILQYLDVHKPSPQATTNTIMSLKHLDTADKLAQALRYWQGFTFTKNYMNLQAAVKAIGTEDQEIEAVQDYPGRWVMCRVGEKATKPAIFHTAAVWRWNSDMETGNYVPIGEVAPTKLVESRIQNEPGTLCQFSYAVDTQHDKSIWAAQQLLEKYVQSVKGFNPHKKSRRPWQDGSNRNEVYVFSAQMSFKRTKYTARKEASLQYTLHPWIADVVAKTSYFANPDRPSLFEPRAGKLIDLKDCETPHLRTGDLVWIGFYVEFIIGLNHWSTTLTPYEIVRVATVTPSLVGDGQYFDDGMDVPRQRLQAGDVIPISEDFPMLSGNVVGDPLELIDYEDPVQGVESDVTLETQTSTQRQIAPTSHVPSDAQFTTAQLSASSIPMQPTLVSAVDEEYIREPQRDRSMSVMSLPSTFDYCSDVESMTRTPTKCKRSFEPPDASLSPKKRRLLSNTNELLNVGLENTTEGSDVRATRNRVTRSQMRTQA
ncbi:hypothetical protein ONZ51_g11514 [Trametes cubensis]|uniref:Uncharacterized protein n=1 Tax=Trametes cubensis TaxID=1111947 RepID=A0AAD7TK87_9APHY|nr:hypothetical protein ONZ51_g11514 [Trametes cubensis]